MGRSIRTKKYKDFVQKLQNARLKAGFTQVEAEKLLKKSQAYISKIERGERGVDAVELAEFAKVYNKDVNYFIR
jgi:transcriptional regulator with XRE-family HTH domain